MIRRTPQEIADFFGCYVAQDMSDRWYAYQKKPHMERKNTWVTDDGGSICIIGDDLFDIPDNHDWTVLYEPRTTCEERTEAPHQSEVHVHREYVVEHHTELAPLMSRITVLMNDGWMPQGGIFRDWDKYNSSFRYYQAMVRGV